MPERAETIFSFVMDEDQQFFIQAWHLARSLIRHCGGDPATVHVQCTPGVEQQRRDVFRTLGCQIHQIDRFGDGRHCNKLQQLESLRDIDCDRIVLLDTDTIAVADVRPFLSGTSILGKIVDVERPPLSILNEIADMAGMRYRPALYRTDALDKETYLANCNGGFYSVPKLQCARLSVEWRKWALWLLANIDPLRRVGRQSHVDQVSFCLAIHQAELPFELAPSNVNYFVHFAGDHYYFDPARPIALLHYHDTACNSGLIEPREELKPYDRATVALANDQIRANFADNAFNGLLRRIAEQPGC